MIVDNLAINTIRGISAQAIEKAKAGHGSMLLYYKEELTDYYRIYYKYIDILKRNEKFI